MRLPSKFRAAVLAVPLVLAAPAVSAQGTGGEPTPAIITVVGQGTVEAVPDVAEIVTGVITRARDARAAIDRNNAAMGTLFAALRAAGIADKDVKTRNFNLAPEYSRATREEPRHVIGYQASNQVSVRIRDLKRVGEIVDSVVGAGSNSISGIRFSIAKPEALLDEARRKAMADAKRRAEMLAQLAGVKVGRVLRIQEGPGRIPQPRMMMEARAATQVAPGTEEVATAVSVQYELK